MELKTEYTIILDFLNKRLSVQVKKKFESAETMELVKAIDYLIENWEEIKSEQNEPDFMKRLKGLQL